jgi:ribonuclease HI
MGINKHRSAVDHSDRPRQWTKDRSFKPDERYGQGIDLDSVEVCDDEHWTFVACDMDDPCQDCGSLSAHVDCIIIAVDGACRNNGTLEAKAAAGVFVGDESTFNDSFILTGSNTTNQTAELRAGIRGLEQALAIRSQGVRGEILQQVVVKADSEYLVNGMTSWVFKWESNGYRTSRGTPVSNASLFRKLQDLTKELNALNVEVLFWHVPRERNKQADMWANLALHNGWTEGSKSPI